MLREFFFLALNYWVSFAASVVLLLVLLLLLFLPLLLLSKGACVVTLLLTNIVENKGAGKSKSKWGSDVSWTCLFFAYTHTHTHTLSLSLSCKGLCLENS
jgi:hypothetical protein